MTSSEHPDSRTQARDAGSTRATRGRKVGLLCSLLLCWCLGLSTGLQAGGSLDSAQVIEILKKDTVLWTQVLEHYELDTTAWGTRCGSHWPHMGGGRIGPYGLLMKPKGASEFTLILSVECEQTFLDKNGKALAKDADGGVNGDIVRNTVRVEEKVRHISISAYKVTEKGGGDTPKVSPKP